MNEKVYKGYNGTLVLKKTCLEIRRGIKGILLGGGFLRGDKTIPYSSIVAVQLKKGGFTAGYLQVTLKGGSEAKGGLFQSTSDENSINFHFNANREFEEAKKIIESRIGDQNRNSDVSDIEKLHELLKKGIITQDEFDKKKKSILDS